MEIFESRGVKLSWSVSPSHLFSCFVSCLFDKNRGPTQLIRVSTYRNVIYFMNEFNVSKNKNHLRFDHINVSCLQNSDQALFSL